MKEKEYGVKAVGQLNEALGGSLSRSERRMETQYNNETIAREHARLQKKSR
jgi:hypothetical protein